MNSYLRQSTASQSRGIGPFVDRTDFVTAETALTIANTDVKLMKNGGASANKNSGGGTHRANGFYGFTFDATDTDTVGELAVSIDVADALPVFCTFVVLEEAVYDALFASGAAGFATGSLTEDGIAEAVLTYNWALITGEAAYCLLNSGRFTRNKRTLSSGTLTVYKENEVDSAWTATVTQSSTASRSITAVDPI